ncbi:MAG: NAD(P)-dependent oxidoreductase [Geminicoccaceae bacterium]|nr:MAG: NAD(P)-dependent oxidoreductase [Geminicoccaceae bacterium]
MRVMVVGGAGFVGLNLVEALLAAGHTVVVFDRQPPLEAASFARAAELVLGDVTDAMSVAAAAAGVDAVVNGAAITAGPQTEAADPKRILEVNLLGFVNLLQAARAAGVRRVVNLSSGSAYGDAAFGADPLDEAATAPDPKTFYALSKFATERVGARLAALWGLDVRSLRLSSVFGPWEHETGVRDTLSPPFQVVQALLRGEPVLLERADTRDWLYAPDVARAVLALLEAPTPAHDLYNVSLGEAYALEAWAERVATQLGGGPVRVAAPGETPNVVTHLPRPRRAMTTGRLRADLGIEAQFGLAASADHYAAWAKAHPTVLLKAGADGRH